jgi:hypothetical protein
MNIPFRTIALIFCPHTQQSPHFKQFSPRLQNAAAATTLRAVAALRPAAVCALSRARAGLSLTTGPLPAYSPSASSVSASAQSMRTGPDQRPHTAPQPGSVAGTAPRTPVPPASLATVEVVVFVNCTLNLSKFRCNLIRFNLN